MFHYRESSCVMKNKKWKIKILYSSNWIQISSTIFIHISKTLNRAWIYTYIHGDDTLFFFLFSFYKTTIRCLKQQGGFSSNAYSSHYRPYLGDEGKKLDTGVELSLITRVLISRAHLVAANSRIITEGDQLRFHPRKNTLLSVYWMSRK